MSESCISVAHEGDDDQPLALLQHPQAESDVSQ